MTLKLPRHDAALHITHNDHKSCYESVGQFLANLDADDGEFGSPEERAAIEAGDELWEIQWYPNTPIGFNRVFAATLERALELANAGEEP